jgi:hypothetical protein
MQSRRGPALLAAAALSLSVLAVSATSSADTPPSASAAGAGAFDRVATYPVFQNLPAGVDPASETVAEISTVSQDGKTVVYSDAPGKRIGFLDITDPAAPKGLGSLELATLGHADDQPTSVAVAGDFVLVAIDESGGNFTNPSGTLKVVRMSDRSVVRTIDLGGQPDSIAISPDGTYAAIAIENQRDEEAGDGGLPQAPAGALVLLDLVSADPASWFKRDVPLVEADGSALDAFVAAGFDTPHDPEPEYVTINSANKLALTLQENNGIVIVDVPTGAIDKAFSAGSTTVTGVDTTKDGLFNPTGTISGPREPDSIGWIGTTHVATANEGDWKGGTRGWTVFDAATGAVAWDAKNSFENLATAHGLHNNDRAAKKGAEPEGLTVSTIGGKTRAFVGSERSNFVAVYDVTDPAAPVFEQVLPTTNGPEGLLAIPERDLLVVSSEVDEADAGVRATVGVFKYGTTRPAFPSIVAAEESSGFPIGWGALGALSAAPGSPGSVWTASDSAYKQGRLYKVDVSSSPAVIERVVTVKNPDGSNATVDIEGLHARARGGFWAASEGTTGAGNALLQLDARGTIKRRVVLPTDIAAQVGKWGFEGVTAVGTGDDEVLYAVLQRPLFSDIAATTPAEGNVARIGKYEVAKGEWTWFTYPLETTGVAGDWIGLSEVTAVDHDTLAIIERDKLNGPAAALKRVYTVDVPAVGGSSTAPVALTKKLAVDVLPALRAFNGWTQEKLEGLTIGADGQVYAVTDNDGLKDATGETQFLCLGAAATIFPAPVPTPNPTPSPNPAPAPAPAEKARTTTKLKVLRTTNRKVRLLVRVSPQAATGKVVIRDGKRKVKVVRLVEGRKRFVVKLKPGRHTLRALYRGDAAHLRSTSKVIKLRLR